MLPTHAPAWEQLSINPKLGISLACGFKEASCFSKRFCRTAQVSPYQLAGQLV